MDYETILTGMQENYRELTGLAPDSASDIGIRLRVLAGQMSSLFERVDSLGRQIFPQTAEGEALERHAACRGLARKPASPAEGQLRFLRAAASAVDIPIAQGVICATRTEPQVRYETTRSGILAAGSTAADIPARAVDAGSLGNAGTGAVCVMVNAAPGITAVRNPSPFAGGVDEEDDDALRGRLLEAFREISNGTNAAFYYDLVMQHDKVLSAQVIPRRRGRGTVDIVYSCASAADENAIREELEAELARRREINVDVAVYAATRQYIDLSAAVAAKEGYDIGALTGSCSSGIIRYVNDLPVGQPLYVAGLTAFLMGLEGVANAAVSAPGADVTPATGGIIRARTAAVARLEQ